MQVGYATAKYRLQMNKQALFQWKNFYRIVKYKLANLITNASEGLAVLLSTSSFTDNEWKQKGPLLS
jgi:hypothetical protein